MRMNNTGYSVQQQENRTKTQPSIILTPCWAGKDIAHVYQVPEPGHKTCHFLFSAIELHVPNQMCCTTFIFFNIVKRASVIAA